jgi:hypothetical protein
VLGYPPDLWRPLLDVDAAITVMRFHIGPHR